LRRWRMRPGVTALTCRRRTRTATRPPTCRCSRPLATRWWSTPIVTYSGPRVPGTGTCCGSRDASPYASGCRCLPRDTPPSVGAQSRSLWPRASRPAGCWTDGSPHRRHLPVGLCWAPRASGWLAAGPVPPPSDGAHLLGRDRCQDDEGDEQQELLHAADGSEFRGVRPTGCVAPSTKALRSSPMSLLGACVPSDRGRPMTGRCEVPRARIGQGWRCGPRGAGGVQT
jgi:hypothetical protein